MVTAPDTHTRELIRARIRELEQMLRKAKDDLALAERLSIEYASNGATVRVGGTATARMDADASFAEKVRRVARFIADGSESFTTPEVVAVFTEKYAPQRKLGKNDRASISGILRKMADAKILLILEAGRGSAPSRYAKGPRFAPGEVHAT